MKMTISEMINSLQCLNVFGGKEIPTVNVALKIADNQREINKAHAEYIKRREAITLKHGKIDPITNQPDVAAAKQGKYVAEIKALLDEEVELNLVTISTTELGPKFSIEPNLLVWLNWMITRDE
jgi:hypothetical protein